MLAMGDDDTIYNSLFDLMAKSDDDEVTLFDIK